MVWGIRGTGPILGAGNSELLITVALLNHHDHKVFLVVKCSSPVWKDSANNCYILLNHHDHVVASVLGSISKAAVLFGKIVQAGQGSVVAYPLLSLTSLPYSTQVYCHQIYL